MKERNFKFRKSYAEVIRVMDDKQAGRFIKAVSDYVFDGRAYDGNDTAIKSKRQTRRYQEPRASQGKGRTAVRCKGNRKRYRGERNAEKYP